MLALAVLAIALVTRTVKQYSRSLLRTVGDSSAGLVLTADAGSSTMTSSYSLSRTSMIVEVRAAGLLLLPVAVGVGVRRWDSLLW
jgi:hypothetical protein